MQLVQFMSIVSLNNHPQADIPHFRVIDEDSKQV